MKSPRRMHTPLSKSVPSLAANQHLAKHQSHPKLTWWHRLHPHTKGKTAEIIARLYFRLHGYRPFPRPKHTLAQTDLLLTKNHLILMVEVKARTTCSKAHLALHPAQIKRLHAQARKLAAQNPHHTIRLDALFLFPHPPFLHHVPHIPLA